MSRWVGHSLRSSQWSENSVKEYQALAAEGTSFKPFFVRVRLARTGLKRLTQRPEIFNPFFVRVRLARRASQPHGGPDDRKPLARAPHIRLSCGPFSALRRLSACRNLNITMRFQLFEGSLPPQRRRTSRCPMTGNRTAAGQFPSGVNFSNAHPSGSFPSI